MHTLGSRVANFFLDKLEKLRLKVSLLWNSKVCPRLGWGMGGAGVVGLSLLLQPDWNSGKSRVASSTWLHHIVPGEQLKPACQINCIRGSSERPRWSPVVPSGAFSYAV